LALFAARSMRILEIPATKSFSLRKRRMAMSSWRKRW
jgi:hypothetical protein